ncbi:hypothetical protein A3Q56_02386 [Intoshia linei]|uniref:A to I editase domain-containing protein n=1 Tax=Intoshia linei TaxID=1819745 RepID=A0A177B6C7_9BILA|nr:hypothetical protein A3Q56_02386 [Intoshia linei]
MEVCKDYAKLNYLESKQLATDYIKHKKALFSHLVNKKMGMWVGKPVDIDKFYVNDGEMDLNDYILENVDDERKRSIDLTRHIFAKSQKIEIHDFKKMKYNPDDESSSKSYLTFNTTVLINSLSDINEITKKYNIKL